ncbi:hypothetical protein IBT50_20655 [Bacillus sp. S70]|uniref:hypothetical protein n=1 Tax=Bacillus TaxID=1386 RepID=UPI0007F96A01|nr:MULTISPECIES: hypothetical protein [Bacillus]ARV92573.1 hypothetical protein BJG91_08065 [Bacillus thuringiensis]MBJ9981108.1 hypothetical protein [Bacillus sp. S29]MBK0103768.1 hypothetical protein [Bacillus sp. S70]MBK0105824.1 hypothetical protein [Bacillus sp. S73]MBK0135686.1 hypothetical protein [Bacillus sp. S72]
MSILGWAKVLETIKMLNDLNKLSYFSLEKYCEENNLTYHKIINFMEIANDIIDDNSPLVEALKQDKEELSKLKKIKGRTTVGNLEILAID